MRKKNRLTLSLGTRMVNSMAIGGIFVGLFDPTGALAAGKTHHAKKGRAKHTITVNLTPVTRIVPAAAAPPHTQPNIQTVNHNQPPQSKTPAPVQQHLQFSSPPVQQHLPIPAAKPFQQQLSFQAPTQKPAPVKRQLPATPQSQSLGTQKQLPLLPITPLPKYDLSKAAPAAKPVVAQKAVPAPAQKPVAILYRPRTRKQPQPA